MPEPLDYRKAGVDIEAAEEALKTVKEQIKATHHARVLSRYGTFSGLFDLQGLGKDPVLVASCDGVGTKLKLAFRTGIHDTVGQDLVNHCVNDMVCCGAKPLFFLDYLGIEKLRPEVFQGLVSGLARACRENGLVLLGGETAELPAMYKPGEYDLAGTIIGVVEREAIIDGSRIEPGDALIGLASTGLHTNGYSLAQKALFEVGRLALQDTPPGLSRPLAEELLSIHRSYGPLVHELLARFDLRGIAHITGGGFEGNVPRILPEGLTVEIDSSRWPVPPIFSLIQSVGNIAPAEMYRVFNMGIGMVLIAPEADAERIIQHCQSRRCPAYPIGRCLSRSDKPGPLLKF